MGKFIFPPNIHVFKNATRTGPGLTPRQCAAAGECYRTQRCMDLCFENVYLCAGFQASYTIAGTLLLDPYNLHIRVVQEPSRCNLNKVKTYHSVELVDRLTQYRHLPVFTAE